MSGLGLEAVCAAVTLAFLVPWTLRSERPARALATYLGMVGVAWVGEASCIALYETYAYAPVWTIFVGPVPLLVTLIWPVVILSARDLARALARGGTPLRVAAITAGIVFADAALIEPVAVRAGLWAWSAPGPFDVPPIGICGWAAFAWCCALGLEMAERGGRRGVVIVAAAPVVTHAALLALWWGALRWIGDAPPEALTALAFATLGGLAAAWAWRARPAIDRAVIWRRAPGAAFFFVLLALTLAGGSTGGGVGLSASATDDVWLVIHAAGFAPPYLALALSSARAEGASAGQSASCSGTE